MEVMVDLGEHGYEAVALPPGPGAGARSMGSAVFLRRSARPSRRAVLHVRDMTGSFAPADLVRWYNERGFHFYVTDLDLADSRRATRTAPGQFAALDAACLHMRQEDGIDAIILSAEGAAAAAAALWCDAGSVPVDALILSDPEFGRAVHGGLDIECPVLVISASQPPGAHRRRQSGLGRGQGSLGQHVTWRYLDAAAGGTDAAQRRRLFDEMGRWLGAYMYGQVRDQLL
jgi:hypothetical protein